MEWLQDLGYVGLFIGSFLAATIVPFSSDILLIAILAAGGNPVSSIVTATLGNWAGGMFSYGMGWLGKWEWIEKYMKVKQSTLEKQKAKIDKYGSLLAFMTWLPFVGDLFAIGLGFYKVNLKKTAIFMLIGKGARFVAWGVIFYYVKPLFETVG